MPNDEQLTLGRNSVTYERHGRKSRGQFARSETCGVTISTGVTACRIAANVERRILTRAISPEETASDHQTVLATTPHCAPHPSNPATFLNGHDHQSIGPNEADQETNKRIVGKVN